MVVKCLLLNMRSNVEGFFQSLAAATKQAREDDQDQNNTKRNIESVSGGHSTFPMI